MLSNTLLLALMAIRRNLARASLTMLGVVIGVAAVITMVTLGNGATRSVGDQIASLGSNLLIVRPGQRMGGMRDISVPNFKLSDADAISAQVPGVEAVAPVVSSSVTAVYQSQNWSTVVTGTSADYLGVGNWNLASGRNFTAVEERAGQSVCILGQTVRSKLFGADDPVGGEVRLKQFSCRIIGLLAAKGEGGMGQDQDDTVLMPIRGVQRRLTGDQDVRAIMVSAAKGASVDEVKQGIEELLRERRRIGEGEEDNFNVFDTRQIAQTLSGTMRVLTMLLGAVAAVSLLVGGIGIMNIMLVSVTERTREIGIRLAVGALERDVLMQFLAEAMVLSCLGGLVGMALAAAASFGLARAMHLPFVPDLGVNLLAFTVSAAIGVVFGYYPAARAARLDPIEALRRE